MRNAVVLSSLLIGACTLGYPNLAKAQEGQALAIFPIEDRGPVLKEKTREVLSDYFAGLMASMGYSLVPRDELKAQLSKQKKASYEACYDQSCQIEVGKEVAASSVVATRVAQVGSQCILTSYLFELRTSATRAAATARSECSEDAMITAMESLAQQLTGRRVSATARAEAKRPPPPRPPERTDPAPKPRAKAVPKKAPEPPPPPPRNDEDRRLAIPFADRPLTLPKGTLIIPASRFGENASILGGFGDTFATLDIGVGYSFTDNLQAQVIFLPLNLAPDAGYGDLGFAALYRLTSGTVQVGLQASVAVPTDEIFQIEAALPIIARSPGFRFETALAIGGIDTDDTDFQGSVAVPLALYAQPNQHFALGFRTTSQILDLSESGDSLNFSLGAGTTITVPGRRGPLVDVDFYFDFPFAITPGGFVTVDDDGFLQENTTNFDIWQISIGATFFFFI